MTTPAQREAWRKAKAQQRKAQRLRGGPLPKGAHRRLHDQPMTQTSIRAPDHTLQALRDYGNGSISAGIRKLVDQYLLK